MASPVKIGKRGITTVSVVIPCFNAAPFVAEAVDSVKAQTLPPTEIIAVDDGSTDGSPEIVEGLSGVRCIRQENRGPSAARNAGVTAATGEVVVFLDADDRLSPSCIESRIKLIEGAAMVVGGYRLVDRAGSVISEDSHLYPPGRIAPNLVLQRMACPTVGLAVDREAFLQVGGFDESLRIGEDSDLLLRMCEAGTCIYDPEPRGDYRIVQGSLSRDYVLWFDSFRRVFAKAAAKGIGTHLQRRVSLTNLTCDRVFGKLLKDRQQPFLTSVAKLIASRPALGYYFTCWAARALGNRVLWLFGKGPLRQRQATSPGSS